MKKTFLLIPLTLFLFTVSCEVHSQDFVTAGLTAQGAACPTNPGNTSTSTSAITISTVTFGGVTFTIGSSVFSGTVGFYGSGDGGTTWQPLNVTPSNGTSAGTGTTSAGLWQANVAGYTNVCMLVAAYSSGTITATIRKSTASARAGGGSGAAPGGATNSVQVNGGGGALSGVSGNVTGQVFTAQTGAAPSFLSPGLLLGNGGVAVTTTPYTVQCDSGTALVDRATVILLQSGASVVTVPSSAASGCGGGFTFRLMDDGAGTVTVNRSGSDTFNILNGSTNTDAATTFNLTNGQYVSMNNGAGLVWEVAQVSGGGTGITTLPSQFTVALPNATWSNPNTAANIDPFAPFFGWPNTRVMRQTLVSSTGAFLNLGDPGTEVGSTTCSAGATAATATAPVMCPATTGASMGTAAGVSGATIYRTGRAHGTMWQGAGAVSSAANVRMFRGLSDQTTATMLASGNPAGNFAGIYSTTVASDYTGLNDTTHYVCVTKNATTETAVASTIAFDVNFHYFAVWEDITGAKYHFYIDNAEVCGTGIATTLPTSGTNIRYVQGIINISTNNVTINTAWAVTQSDK